MRNIWLASKHGSDYTLLKAEHNFDLLTILNYFDGIASGILQEVYSEEMARKYLALPLEKSVKALLLGESGDEWVAERSLFPPSHFPSLMTVYGRWFPATTTHPPSDEIAAAPLEQRPVSGPEGA